MLFLSILLASLIESVFSFAGVLLVVAGGFFVRNVVHRMLGFAVGALIGVAFFDILPEAVAAIPADTAFRFVVLGIFIFFVIERFFRWYHAEEGDWKVQPYTSLVFIGGVLHNFIDGIALTLSFFVSPSLGVATTLAILLHEIPHGIADFTALQKGGYARVLALWYSFLVSLTTVLGAVVTFLFGGFLEGAIPYILAIMAGNFLYLALSDLLPETHEESGFGHFVGQVFLMIAGAAMMLAFSVLIAE